MIYLNLNGSRMPALGFGTWQLEGETCVKAIDTALKIGYRHIDTAQMYNNEAEVGKALLNTNRSDIFLTTKLWITNFEPKDVAASFNESLNKLQTDYVDLLLMHWPNPDVNMGETLAAMQELVTKNKVRNIGVSNFPVAQMREAVEVHKAPIACNQVEYHAMLSQAPVLDYAHKHNIAITAYSPLLRGVLTDNKTLIDIGKKYNKTSGQIALRWLMEQGVAAIPKAASEKNAKLNFDIFDFELSPADKTTIDALPKNKRMVNPDFAPVWDR